MPATNFTTRINIKIIIHWLIIATLIGIVAFHFNENPNGLSIVILILISTILFNKVDYLKLKDEFLIHKKIYGFIIIKKTSYALDTINTIQHDGFPFGQLPSDDESRLIFRVLTGIYFYSPTSFLTINFKDGTHVMLKLNISLKEIKRISNKLNSRIKFIFIPY